jgi:hypothetical protein
MPAIDASAMSHSEGVFMITKLRVPASALLAAALVAGCGGPAAKEGIPPNVDFSGKTDYSPMAKPLTGVFGADAQSKADVAAKKEAAEKKTATPEATPAPEK